MSQFIIQNYVFDASAKTITFPDDTALRLEGFQLITHLPSGAIIYQFNSAAKGGSIVGNVLTLDHDTTALADADALQILYNEPQSEDPIAALHEAIDSLLLVAQIMLRAQPRVDAAGRVIFNGSEVTQPVSGTVTSNIGTGTLAALTNLTQISGQPVPYIGYDRPPHIYDNIKVT
jgi:hypothetical protein